MSDMISHIQSEREQYKLQRDKLLALLKEAIGADDGSTCWEKIREAIKEVEEEG